MRRRAPRESSIISGVSSLPALTSAVVDKYRGEFKRLDAIRIGITSGALMPGIATIRSVAGLLRQAIPYAGEGALDRRARLARSRSYTNSLESSGLSADQPL